jgi:thiol:disulfide interchange protein DsbC
MRIRVRTTLLLAGLLHLAPGFAASPAAPAGEQEARRMATLKSTLEARFPEAKIQSIAPSQIPGIYEVISANLIVYSDGAGEYVLRGPMIEARSRTNVTEERLGEINAIDFASLPADLAVKIVKGNGKRRLALFADPFCPFCKELEQILAGITDVTIDLYLLPLEGIHPGATQKSQDIWCTAEPGKSWDAWMMRDEPVPAAPAECAPGPMPRIVELARKHGINSTPTLVFGSGTRMSGVLSAERLERLLEGGARATAAR